MLRVAWPKKVIESNKAFSSLIVEVASESMANRLLDHGIIESNSEHNCVYFEKGCRVLQCFKCYKHGHMTYACRNGPFCHKCGKNHEAETCTSAKNGKRCPSCPTATDHKPWMAACPKFKLEKQIATEKFKNRPARYPDNSSEVFKFGLKTNSNSGSTSVSGSEYASAALNFLNSIPSS